MTVERLIAALKKLPPKNRKSQVHWIDALGNYGYLQSVDVSPDEEDVVELSVNEAADSWKDHQL